VSKLLGKRQLGRPRKRLEFNSKMEIGSGNGEVEGTSLNSCPVTDIIHDNEPSGSATTVLVIQKKWVKQMIEAACNYKAADRLRGD
jgi:hypothetical protein